MRTEIHKRTELRDKYIFIFFQRKTTALLESCTEMASL